MKTEYNINRVFVYTLSALLLFVLAPQLCNAAMSKWSKDQHHSFFDHLYDEGVVKDATQRMNYTFFISCVGSFYSQKYSYDEWYKLFTAKETTKQQDFEFQSVQTTCQKMIQQENDCIGKSCKRTLWI